MTLLTERKSIRKYDPNFKITKEEMIQILKLATRAPSSTNMQSWRFFVVESDDAKAKLKTALYGNQNQLETSAAMICVFTDLKKHLYAEKIMNMAYEKKSHRFRSERKTHYILNGKCF